MKLLKSTIIAISLALSLGSFSSTAVACTDGRTCVGNEAAVDFIVGYVADAIKSIENEKDTATILNHIKQAKNMTKEINVNDVVDRNKIRANGRLKKARSAIKKGNMSEGIDLLKDAKKRYAALKGMF